MSITPFGQFDSLQKALKAGFGERRVPNSSILQILQDRACRRLGVHLPDPENLPEAPIKVSDDAKTLRDPQGRYQVLGEIARGGMGVVYKGRDIDLGRDVAMKVLRDEYLDEPGVLERFVEEAQIGGQLEHPGIVPVYELGLQHDQRPYFAMKLIKGETLAEQLARRADPGTDRRRFLGIFEQVCQTVAFAHARRVVHRDLKPANVMIGSFGQVQVVDWGLAKVLSKGGIADEKRSAKDATVRSLISTVRSKKDAGTDSVAGSVLGTPAYMSPEQAAGDVEHMDRCSDVFGLGAILCEILTGAPPYLEKHGDLLKQAARGDLTEARSRIEESGCEEALVKLCLECLSPARRARPDSAGEVVSVLGQYLSSVEERARNAELRAVEAKVKARSTRLLAAAAALVLSLGSATYIWLQGQANDRRDLAEQQVAQSLGRANVLLGQAREAGLEDLGLWDQTITAFQRAERDAASPDVSPATKETVQVDLREAVTQQTAARRQAELNARDRTMLAQLIELRIPKDEDVSGANWPEREARRLHAAYALAFDTYLEERLDSLSVEALSDSEIAVPLAAALDHWALERDVLVGTEDAPDPDETENLRRIARSLDRDDPWRNRLRDLLPHPADQRAELERLAQAHDLETQEATSLILLGEALWRADARDLAVEVYRLGREVHADDFWMAFRLGLLLERLEEPRWDQAIQAYRIANALQHEMREVRHRLAIALTRNGEPEAALRIFKRLVDSDPGHKGWNVHVGDLLAEVEGREAAIAYFQEKVRTYPDASWPYEELGEHLVQGDRSDLTIESLEYALGIDPDWKALHPVAHALHDNGYLEEALGAYRRLMELDPTKPHWHEAQVLDQLGRSVEALEKYRSVVEAVPESSARQAAAVRNAFAWFLVTTRQESLRDANQAIALVQSAIDLNRTTSSLNTLGVALFRAGRFQEALDALYQAMDLRPQSDPSMTDWLFYAMALQRLGDPANARWWFDRARDQIAEMPEVGEELKGFLEEAKDIFGGS